MTKRPIREQSCELIPEPRELLFIDKPRLVEASYEKTPVAIQITCLTFERKKQEKKQQKKKYGKGGGSLHAWDSLVDDLDDADTIHDYLGSDCQMLDDSGNPWPHGFIRIDMRDGTTGKMKVSEFEGVGSRNVAHAKPKSRTKSQTTQSEDWDEDVCQMEIDEAREADRLNEPTLNLFNPLSLPMKWFWQNEVDPMELGTEPTADPSKLEVEPTVGAGAELYDQPNDELVLTMESVAGPSM